MVQQIEQVVFERRSFCIRNINVNESDATVPGSASMATCCKKPEKLCANCKALGATLQSPATFLFLIPGQKRHWEKSKHAVLLI